MKYLYVIPSGSGGSSTRDGTIMGVVNTSEVINPADHDYTGLDVAFVPIADGVDRAEDLIGSYFTSPPSPGIGSVAIDTIANLRSQIVETPVPFALRNVANIGLFCSHDGTVWSVNHHGGLRSVNTISISSAGTGYSTGTDIAVENVQDALGRNLTVNIDSVGGSGEITGVSINNAGNLYKVANTVRVSGGNEDAILSIDDVARLKFGVLGTGRGASGLSGPEDLNPSTLTLDSNRRTLDDMILYSPSTEKYVKYNASLGGFPSSADFFSVGDYRLWVSDGVGSEFKFEVTCPGPQDVNTSFDLYGEDLVFGTTY